MEPTPMRARARARVTSGRFSAEIEERTSLIPAEIKFWRNTLLFAGRDFPFSTTWAHPKGEKDTLIEILGDVGYWQIVVVLLMMMFNMPVVFHVASPEVTAALHVYWCDRPTNKLTWEQFIEIGTVKKTTIKGEVVDDPCNIKNYTYEHATYEELKNSVPQGIRPCTDWIYDRNKTSIISQFNLACVPLPVNNLAESIFSLGGAIGVLAIAYLSDRFGRRKLLMIAQGFVVFFGFLTANVLSYAAYLTVRFALGFACSAVLLCSSVICVEITGGTWMSILSTIYMYSYSFAYIGLYLLNRFFYNWTYLQYSITLVLILLLSIWWLVPESPRYLLTIQNLPRLMNVLETANAMNKKPLAQNTSTLLKMLPPMRVPLRRVSPTMMYRTKAMRRLTIVVPFATFFSSVNYYGLALNGDLFTLGFFYSGVIEALAVSVVLFLNVNNDVLMIIVTNTLAGISCLLVIPFIERYLTLLDVCCIATRFFGGMAYSSISSIPATMYPTTIRSLGVGWSQFWSNLATAIVANIIFAGDYSPALPFAILGVSALLASFALLFVPGRTVRDINDLVEEEEYGHMRMAQIRAENGGKLPDDFVAPARWIQPKDMKVEMVSRKKKRGALLERIEDIVVADLPWTSSSREKPKPEKGRGSRPVGENIYERDNEPDPTLKFRPPSPEKKK